MCFFVQILKNKKLWYFCFFEGSLSSSKTSFKKPKKTSFFFGFKNLNQTKNKRTQGKPKKKSFDLTPKLLQKVLFFCFFGVLEVS